MGIYIDRCICFDQRFDRLVALARQSGAQTVESLQTQVTFGEKCALCRPYIERALQTGQVIFRELLSAEPGCGTGTRPAASASGKVSPPVVDG